MKKIAFASHVALINGEKYDGLGNVLTDELVSMGVDFISVRHSIDGKLPSKMYEFQQGEAVRSEEMNIVSNPAPLRYVSEVFKTVRRFNRIKDVDIFIGVDPLNALTGIILKKVKKVKKVIFFTADYSQDRFDNKILNRIYHYIDAFCVKKSDEVWSVSTKIMDVRKNMGLPDERSVFIPNVPPVKYNTLRDVEKKQHELVTTGVIDKQLDYEGIIEAVYRLKDSYPDIRLTIIGNGPEENNIKSLVNSLKLDKEVRFTGRLPLSETLDIVSRSGVGLALYTGLWEFNQYGDSTKCREYFTYGLPVLSTDTHSTVDEIREYKAGKISEIGVDSYVDSLKDIFKNYNEYSKRSSALGKKYQGIHRRELLRIMKEQ